MIQARVHAGLAHAKVHGTKTGRAIGPRITAAQEAVIRTYLAAGVGDGTVMRIRRNGV